MLQDVVQFADDTRLIFKRKTIGGLMHTIQDALTQTDCYLKGNHLKLNIARTELINFGDKFLRILKYRMIDNVLVLNTYFRYLGIRTH